MSEIDISYEKFKDYIEKIETANNGMSTTIITPQDMRTTLSANRAGKDSYEDGRNALISVREQLSIDVVNLHQLAESFKEFDEEQGKLYGEG